MDKARATKLMNELQTLLNKFAADNNLSMTNISVRYDQYGLKATSSFGDKDTAGEGVDPKWIRNFDTLCHMYGLTREDRGQEVDYRGSKVKILGMSSASKIIFERDGKKFTTNVNDFAGAIGRKKSNPEDRLIMKRFPNRWNDDFDRDFNWMSKMFKVVFTIVLILILGIIGLQVGLTVFVVKQVADVTQNSTSDEAGHKIGKFIGSVMKGIEEGK